MRPLWRIFCVSLAVTFTASLERAAAQGGPESYPEVRKKQPVPIYMAIDPALFGMPDATTAGVQAGVTLTTYTGPMAITTPGTVIENRIINGELTVKASNVTIRNSVIQSDGWRGIEGENSPNLRVENCDIIGGNLTNSGILGSGTFVGNDIRHVSIGIQLTNEGASTVRDNYVHDLFYGNGDQHYDGLTLLGGQNGVVIEHNTFSLPTDGGTASILIQNVFGPVNDVLINNNLMYGDPSYTIYVTGTQTTNVSVTNNYLDKGKYGYFIIDGTNPTISGNVLWDDHVDPTPYPTGPVDLSPYGPAARAQERAVRDVTPSGISRVFRNTVAVPDPEPPSIPQEARPPRILENIRPQPDESLRSGASVFHLAGVQVPPTQKLCTTSAGGRWTCGIRAHVMITNLLRAKGAECFVADEARALAQCTAEGVDVSLRLLELGLVELAPGVDNRRYVAAAQAAKRQGRGLWSRSP